MPADDSRPAGRTGRLALFLRAAVFDYVLVLVVCTALAFTVSYGFNSAPDLRGNVGLIAGVCAVLLAALYASGWSKRALPVSAVLYVLLAAGAVAAISSLSPEATDLFVDGQVNDVENNYAVFGLVVVVIPPIVYLLSRRTWGVALLFFAGVLACGTIQFLYRDWISSQPGTIAALVAYVGMGALFMMQGYRQGVLKSHVVKRTSFASAFAFGVAGSLLCAGVGVLAFFAVISGLGLTTVDAKPFEDYFSRPVIEYDGTFNQQPVYDPNVGTSRLSDEVDTTSDDEYGAESEQQSPSVGGFSFVATIMDTLDVEDWQEQFEAIRFDVPVPLRILLALLPLAVIAAIVFVRYRMRERRLRKIEQHPYAERVALLYNFFMRGFERMKVEKPATATPLEFAMSSAGELAGFMRNDSQADLLGITLIYQRAVYGAGNVSAEDYRYVRDYYQAFFKNAHARMGHPRWILRGFWRI
ncbi:MAG TPA: hypothetical protein DCP91_06455 [Eggerthellaceae bacterium]|nr:hypothetical protein [Eggerthellaceae bacterium]